MPPIVCIVGHSESGKTTLVEKLVRELKLRGYRVATVKHAQDINLGDSDKDSSRHLEAGSEATIISSPDKLVLIKPVATGITLDEVAQLFGEDYDLVLVEGFKQGKAPKIEVHRREAGPPLKDIKQLVAIVTDEPLDTEVRQFSLEDVKGLADLLEDGFIKPQGDQVSLYINNAPVALKAFPKEFVTNVLLAMTSSLKGVGKVRSLALFLRKKG